MTDQLILPGDYVVHRTQRVGDFEVRKVQKVTPVRVVLATRAYAVNWATRENVLYATTDEARAKRLCEKMESSRALMEQEKRGASDRHNERIAKLAREAAR